MTPSRESVNLGVETTMRKPFDPLGGAHKIRKWSHVSDVDGRAYEGFTCSCGYVGSAPLGTPDVERGPGWTSKPGSVRQQITWHLNVARALTGIGLATPEGVSLLRKIR